MRKETVMWSCQHGDGAGLERLGPVDCAVLHAGAASVPAKFGGRPLSLTAERAAAAAEVLGSQHIVVAHQDGWSHFREGPERTKAAFESAGTSRRLCAARAGHWCVPAGDGAGLPGRGPVRPRTWT
jgi:hypothetical protein